MINFCYYCKYINDKLLILIKIKFEVNALKSYFIVPKYTHQNMGLSPGSFTL